MELTTTVPPLRTFYVYLTSGCNCACRHCYFVPETGKADNSRNDILSLMTLRRAIEQALPLGLQALKLTGGEPTFHPRFTDFLNLQKEYGLPANLETNGMLVDRRLAELLRESGVECVAVSLDGSQAATHDAIRGVSGGFTRTCAGIRNLVAAGYSPELIFTLQRSNVDELDGYIHLAEELGAGNVKLNILQPMLRGAKLATGDEGLGVGELIALATRLENTTNTRNIQVFMDMPMAFRPLGRLFDGTGCGVCSIRHILGILPRGEYALCGVGQHDSSLSMGTVDASSLEEVWKAHPVLVRMRAGLPGDLQGVCGECLMKASCLGSCVAANYHRSGHLFAPFWFCQAAVDAGLFPVSRRR